MEDTTNKNKTAAYTATDTTDTLATTETTATNSARESQVVRVHSSRDNVRRYHLRPFKAS